MTGVAVIFLASLVALVYGLSVTTDHTVKGPPALVVFGGLIGSGLVLAVNAL